jgi:hypothetical protein
LPSTLTDKILQNKHLHGGERELTRTFVLARQMLLCRVNEKRPPTNDLHSPFATFLFAPLRMLDRLLATLLLIPFQPASFETVAPEKWGRFFFAAMVHIQY